MNKKWVKTENGMREEWVCEGEIDMELLSELVRPATKEVIKIWITRLAQFKTPYNTDETQANIILNDYSIEFEGLSELAVYSAYKELRNMPGKFFPDPDTVCIAFNNANRWVKRIDGILKAQK